MNVSNFIYPQMLAPIIGGLLFDFVGYSFAALFIAAWNSISGIVEYTLLILIYRWDLSNIDVPNYHRSLPHDFRDFPEKFRFP